MMRQPDLGSKTPEAFWEDIYGKASPETSGTPSKILAKYATDLAPGRALELGCAKGDDAVWLAKQGWQVLGVDISKTALTIAAGNAERNGVTDRVALEQHDLTKSFPKGTFDLVSALFLQTPFDFPRAKVLQAAASTVRPAGLLLLATHQTYASWSWTASSEPEITATMRLLEIDLDLSEWDQVFTGPLGRMANGPNGQTEFVTDAVVALQRR
jgi:SAM-dependent methyltransferase